MLGLGGETGKRKWHVGGGVFLKGGRGLGAEGGAKDCFNVQGSLNFRKGKVNTKKGKSSQKRQKQGG